MTTLAALAATLARIAGGSVVEVESEIATAETAQRMLTPQDGKEELLVFTAERIEGPTFTPRKGGAAASTIQQVLADLGIGDHGQAVEVTTGGLVCHVSVLAQESDILDQGIPAEDPLALAGTPTTNSKSGWTVDDDFDAEHLGELVVHLDPVALVTVFDAKTLMLFFQVGEDFIGTGAGTLATEVAQDVFAGKVQSGMLQQTRIQSRQGGGIAKEQIEGEFGLIDDPLIGKPLAEVAE